MLASASVRNSMPYAPAADKFDRWCTIVYVYHAARTGRVTGAESTAHQLYKGTWNDIREIEAALCIIA